MTVGDSIIDAIVKQGLVQWGPVALSGLTFGQALEFIKDGRHVAREGWKQGERLFMLPGATVPKSAIHDPALRELLEAEVVGESFEALPTIRMFTADKKVLTGWLASQPDMFATDYYVVA